MSCSSACGVATSRNHWLAFSLRFAVWVERGVEVVPAVCDRLQVTPSVRACVRSNASFNALSGSVPASIGNLGITQYFYASNNKFTGTVPSGIHLMAALQSL